MVTRCTLPLSDLPVALIPCAFLWSLVADVTRRREAESTAVWAVRARAGGFRGCGRCRLVGLADHAARARCARSGGPPRHHQLRKPRTHRGCRAEAARADRLSRFSDDRRRRGRLDRRGACVPPRLAGARGGGDRAARRGRRSAELTGVSGYLGSLPIRVGNLAQEQHQLDVYGWVIDAIWNLVDAGHSLGRRSRKVLVDYADLVCRE
jgi:hypothetical protein